MTYIESHQKDLYLILLHDINPATHFLCKKRCKYIYRKMDYYIRGISTVSHILKEPSINFIKKIQEAMKMECTCFQYERIKSNLNRILDKKLRRKIYRTLLIQQQSWYRPQWILHHPKKGVIYLPDPNKVFDWNGAKIAILEAFEHAKLSGKKTIVHSLNYKAPCPSSMFANYYGKKQ